MDRVLAVLEILATPFMIFNLLGGIVSGVWLAAVGDWGSIGYGILSMVFSSIVLGIALIPSMMLLIPSAHFLENGPRFPFYLFAFFSNLYVVALMTIWCGAVLLFFVERSTENSYIPILIWSYNVALAPWMYMASKDVQSGDGNGSVAMVFFAQVGYVLLILLAIFSGASFLEAMLLFIAVMLVGVTLQFAITVAMMKEEDQRKNIFPGDV